MYIQSKKVKHSLHLDVFMTSKNSLFDVQTLHTLTYRRSWLDVEIVKLFSPW